MTVLLAAAGNAYAGLDVFIEVINKGSLEAIASALATIKKTLGENGDCNVDAEVGADARTVSDTVTATCDGCTTFNRKCAGAADELDTIKSCCKSHQHCVRKDASVAKCRNKSGNLPRSWDGSVVECAAA